MKGKDTMRSTVWMPAVLLLMLIAGIVQAAEKSPTVLLQEALYQEQTEGDLDKAIELYGQVREQAADIERLAAQATYQLGMCHLKKGENEKAIDYFEEVVGYYPNQTSSVENAQAQLDKIAPEQPKDSVFEQIDMQTLRFVAETYGITATMAGAKNLQANGHVYYADPNGYRYSGGLNSYYNWTGQTISQKVFLSHMSGKDYTHYDASGKELNIEFEDSGKQPNHYKVYWIPDEPLAPGEFLYYGWSSNTKQKLMKSPEDDYTLWMQNDYGDAVIETFFLVLPKTVKIIDNATPPTGNKSLLNFNVYWWTKQVPQGENHAETVTLMPLKKISPEETAKLVEKAVLTISTCAETDPRVKKSLKTLRKIQSESLINELLPYFDSERPTIRRSAIYILWRGQLLDATAAEQKLIDLCSHEENFTRGMAALTLGEHKLAAGYDSLVNMTLNDEDGYARRCGAYALGLFGDEKALPILEQALEDTDPLVKQNAQAAITMLTELDDEQAKAPDPEPKMTQEMSKDIQPDGTIIFRSPNYVINKGTEPITEQGFINSDFVELTAMTNEQGNPVEFTTTHEGNHYRYHVTLDPPVMPGETFVYYTEGTISGLIKPVAGKENTYRYYMNHSPSTGQPVLRIETYLLPEGAEVVSILDDDMKQSEQDGRIMLHVEKVIPASGSLLTSFQYKILDKTQRWVEDFFKHNYRDITHRKTLEWGEPTENEDGTISIRYKYEAIIWDKDKIIEDKVWTFDEQGKFIHVRKVGAEDIYSLAGAQALVENFFANNYRDITKRETIEWGQPTKEPNGDVSIRYKYEATIRDEDTIIQDKIWTFDENGKFVSVNDAATATN